MSRLPSDGIADKVGGVGAACGRLGWPRSDCAPARAVVGSNLWIMTELAERLPESNPSRSDAFRLTYALHCESVSVEFTQDRVLIGRNADCDVVLPLASVSRNHAEIRRDAEGWSISDLGSRNGTFVNDQPVQTQPLHHGDLITPGPPLDCPLTITFQVVVSPEKPVVFGEHFDCGNVSMSIGVEDFERLADGVSEPVPQQRQGIAGIPSTPGAARERAPDRRRKSTVGLFKQVSQVLLTSEHLNDTLEKVADLALSHLSAQHACICLCDESMETVQLKAQRTRGGPSSGSIAISRSVAREAIRTRQALLVSDTSSDTRFAQAPSINVLNIVAAMCAPLYHAGQLLGLIYVDTNRSADLFGAEDLEVLAALGGLTAVGIQQARLREAVGRERTIRTRLARYSSPRVVEQIMNGELRPDCEMAAQEREITVLFGDLSKFTPMAEEMSPAEVTQVLNGAFEQFTHAVFMYDGTLDKYMGDAVMAIFGAPLRQPDHAERAVRAAMLMQQLLGEFNLSRPQGKQLQLRVGINSGTAVVGDVGSPIRRDYTAIGDPVNVASRLESSVAEPGQVVIGPDTYELVKDVIDCQLLAEVRLKGKQDAIRPYLVTGRWSEETFPEKSRLT